MFQKVLGTLVVAVAHCCAKSTRSIPGHCMNSVYVFGGTSSTLTAPVQASNLGKRPDKDSTSCTRSTEQCSESGVVLCTALQSYTLPGAAP